jgi:plastocyanin
MNTLDSRSLGIGDCFAVKFTAPGAIRHVFSAGAHAPATISPNEGFPIAVSAKRDPKAPPTQYYVQVMKKGNQLVPDAEKLDAEVGDTVLWYTTDPAAAGFGVAGSGQNLAFGSHSLKAEAIYTHAFGTPGTYEWTDPLAGNISGTVVVQPVTPKTDKEKQDWLNSLSQAASFEIRGGKVTPAKVEVVVGQTVFWKVWDGEGLAIVDKRLLG